MDWESIQDENIQNPNAGNGGDLVKHTVYLATLEYLLGQQPWKEDIRVHECHAGRGIYRLGPSHQWRNVLSSLFASGKGEEPVVLRDIQEAILRSLGRWPGVPQQIEWYVGSAFMNAWILEQHKSGSRVLDLYEREPDTRRVLKSFLTSGKFAGVHVNVPPASDEAVFDGERHVEINMKSWGNRDVVFLDPFARWRKPEHQVDRDRYASILAALIRRLPDSPALVMFWTWGSAALSADEDLTGLGKRVKNGYQDLLTKIQGAGSQIFLIDWHWGYWFAMWVVVNEEHIRPLKHHIDRRCRALANHLRSNGGPWKHPNIGVSII